ncbi:hypothetical protein [Caudoviricetes sp.]|nr:hypothetical protein [Caudoviricetes sp.]
MATEKCAITTYYRFIHMTYTTTAYIYIILFK